MIRITGSISGRVQRVGYRAKVISLAKDLGLAGFIQNRPDGKTLVIAESEKKGDLERFASAIRIKNGLIDVENIALEYSPGSGEYSTFRKITGPDEVGERLDDGIEILKELVVGLGNLTTITKDGFENLNGKVESINGKIENIDGKMGQMLEKQDRMLDKQDQMLDKQDQMLDKQDQMLDKQDESVELLKGVKDDTSAIRNGFRRSEGSNLEEKYEKLSREVADKRSAFRR